MVRNKVASVSEEDIDKIINKLLEIHVNSEEDDVTNICDAYHKMILAVAMIEEIADLPRLPRMHSSLLDAEISTIEETDQQEEVAEAVAREVAEVTGSTGALVHQSTPSADVDPVEAAQSFSQDLFSADEDDSDGEANTDLEEDSNSAEENSQAVDVGDHAEGYEARRDAPAMAVVEADANHADVEVVEQAAVEPEAGGVQNPVPVRQAI